VCSSNFFLYFTRADYELQCVALCRLIHSPRSSRSPSSRLSPHSFVRWLWHSVRYFVRVHQIQFKTWSYKYDNCERYYMPFTVVGGGGEGTWSCFYDLHVYDIARKSVRVTFRVFLELGFFHMLNSSFEFVWQRVIASYYTSCSNKPTAILSRRRTTSFLFSRLEFTNLSI